MYAIPSEVDPMISVTVVSLHHANRPVPNVTAEGTDEQPANVT
jgi:hypothetical protein